MRLRDFQISVPSDPDLRITQQRNAFVFPLYEEIRLALKATRMIEAPFVKIVLGLEWPSPAPSRTRVTGVCNVDAVCLVTVDTTPSLFEGAKPDRERIRRLLTTCLDGISQALGWKSSVFDRIVAGAWRGTSVCDAEIARTRVAARGAEAAAYLVADPGLSRIVLRARRDELADEVVVRTVHGPLWLEDDFPAVRGRTRDDAYDVVDRRGRVLASMPLPRRASTKNAAPRLALVKVLLPLDVGAWHGSEAETLWAEPLGGDEFRIQNSPFFAFGVSHEDIVLAEVVHRRLQFKAVVARSGRSTYRLWLHTPDTTSRAFIAAWTPLEQLGCSYEGGLVYSVDVPASADIQVVYALLQAGETAGVWDFEEGHCGHPLDEAPAAHKQFPDDDDRMALLKGT